MLDTLTLDFSPAVVSLGATAGPQARERRGEFHVGWFLLNRDVNSASVRYRCFHMARALQESGVRHSYFTDAEKLCSAMKTLDAVVVVKRLDIPVLRVAASANAQRKAIFLDICDDLLAERYSKNAGGINRMVFAGIASQLDGIVTPSAAMAERMKGYCRDLCKSETPVHVIPDIAETEELFWRTAAFAVGGQQGETTFTPAKLLPITGTSKRALWFGNFGAPHSNFGMASLLPAISSLRSVHKDIPLELVVVSNDETVYQGLIEGCGVPSRYVPWSSEAVYVELRQADVALLTGGDDEFCTIKSANRALQALAMGVPVIATSSTALTEFVDCIALDHVEKGLRAYLGPDGNRNVSNAIAQAQRILQRYRPDRMANIWFDLFERSLERKRETRSEKAKGALLFVIEAGDEPTHFKDALTLCKKKKLNVEAIVTAAACQAQPQLRDTFIGNQLVPTVVTTPKHIYPDRLHGVAKLIVEACAGDVTSPLSAWAAERGVPVVTMAQLRQELGGDAGRVREAAASVASPPRQPGPHPERLDSNGSATWVFVVHQNARGWILDAICREIGSRQPDSWRVDYNSPELPPGRNYFFSHYSLYQKHFRRNPRVFEKSGSFIWYTHPRAETPEAVKDLLQAFSRATQVIFTCGATRELWLRRGLAPERCQVVLGGADPDLFRKHERGRGVVGLSSSFYERKNPDCLLDLVKMLPHRRFHLIGRHWEQYALFEEMKAAPNFSYLTVPYEDYPKQYDKFDVFLSMSTLEGGPIPLLEAMMCNAVPVASDTGFAADLIQHGKNGYLIDTDAPADRVAPLIENAFSLDVDVRETVVEYSWENFSRSIVALGR